MTDPQATLALTQALIARRSVTPEDAGCMDQIVQRLQPLGFQPEFMPSGDTRNLWLRRGAAGPVFAFAGHTDVVPTGPESAWDSPPFQPTVRDGYLYGRGAADMKSGLAAMVVACERFVNSHPHHRGSIALLLTSDEEGPATDGTVKVVETLTARGEQIDWCLIGEPSSTTHLGDVVKHGRRGSHSARLVVHGKQGHVAYPHLADNPIHRIAPALTELTTRIWDRGNNRFPPTTLQISNIHGGTGAGNVIPGSVEVLLNLRYSTQTTHRRLEHAVAQTLDRHGLHYDIDWTLSGEPFLTDGGELLDAITDALRECCGRSPQTSTAGGTSDGRFIAPTGAQVVELGPVNATIHQTNERVRIADLALLEAAYLGVLQRLLG